MPWVSGVPQGLNSPNYAASLAGLLSKRELRLPFCCLCKIHFMKTLLEHISAIPQEVRDRYDFSKAVYTRALAPITGIICPQHGTFQQYAGNLRKGSGCPSCGAELRVVHRRTPAQEYIVRATEKHGGLYSYENTIFTKMNAQIEVVCPQHGAFHISASKHLYLGQGCTVCAQEAKKERMRKYRPLGLQKRRKVELKPTEALFHCEAHGTTHAVPKVWLQRGFNPCPECAKER